MQRFVPIVALTVLVGVSAGACSKKTTQPTPADPNTVLFTSALLASNEVPAIGNAADANGIGTASITFHLTRDASNNVTAATADYVVTLSGFPAGTPLTNAHIHVGAAGVGPGNVVAATSLASGEVVLTNGSGGFTKNGQNVDAATAQSILNNPAGFYFNVHTQANAGGAVRGQLVKQ
jgi:hypothetical protein